MLNLVPNKLKPLVDIHDFKKEIKRGSQKTAHVGYAKLYTIYWFYLNFQVCSCF